MPQAVQLIFKMEADSFGSLMHWFAALTVVVVALVCKFMGRGLVSSAAILIGLVAGYAVAWAQGMVNFGAVAKAGFFQFQLYSHTALNLA